jgi:hypothetical protein
MFPADGCMRRLQASTVPWPSLLKLPAIEEQFLLKNSSHGFRISVPGAFHNGFASHFYGKLEPADGTTVVRGVVRLSAGGLLFFAWVGAFMLAVLLPLYSEFEVEVVVWWVMIAFGLWRFGDRLAPGTVAEYGQFFQKALAAVQIEN